MEQGYLNALSEIGVKKDKTQMVEFLKNKVIAYISFHNLSFSKSEIYNFCSDIGFDVHELENFKKVTIDQYGRILNTTYHFNSIIYIFNSIYTFDELVTFLCYFANSNTPNEHREKINEIITDSIKECDTDIYVVQKENNLHAYRKEADMVNELSNNPKINQNYGINSKNIFIVHGHDDLMKMSVSNFIRKIGFNPIILHEQPNGGKTIIEKFQDYSDVAFAIILYSLDDEMKTGKMRARQNVIFEHGFFIGKLGRNRAVGLVKEVHNIELPSDLHGVVYIPFNNNWELDIAKEMKYSGLEIDLNKI